MVGPLDSVYVEVGGDPFEIASISFERPDGECEANARLIAAAPALLEAARAALESLDAVDVPQEWDSRPLLRAAIAAATGEQD